jgi:hypothetical protein
MTQLNSGYMSRGQRVAREESFNRLLLDGQDVILKVAERIETQAIDPDDPYNKGYTTVETIKTKRVRARKIGSKRKPYMANTLTKFGVSLDGDLLISAKYSDYNDFKSCVEITYEGQRYENIKMQSEDAPYGYSPFCFIATATLKGSSV